MVSAPFRGLVAQIDAVLKDIGVEDSRRDYFYLAETGNPPTRPDKSNARMRVTAGRAARHFARTHLSPIASARRCASYLSA